MSQARRNQVATYFDKISASYTTRYGKQNPFHNYFFRQRLKAATEGFTIDGKSVLDIGAGTGALYDELMLNFSNVNYFACDISSQMLAQSAIPQERMFVGRAKEINFPIKRFDFIFSLGVTTYQSSMELADDWRFIADRLTPNGMSAISFTNRASIDHTLRIAMKPVKPFIGNGVFGQHFPIFAYSSREVQEMARTVGLRVFRTTFLNQTFLPFNKFLPHFSVGLAKIIERAPTRVLPLLSSDFIVFVERS
ncbi:MAG TPA: class I SAM-dependent methyltransferase [Bradyrhizobium sp.]|nr:class I SAM-dependent methyltransferase [Bradyrhizobium sp.]